MPKNPIMDQLDIDEKSLLNPITEKTGIGQWLTIFLFKPNMLRTLIRMIFLSLSFIWWLIQRDFVPLVVVFLTLTIWDMVSVVYWRRQVLATRQKMAETVEKMQKLDQLIGQKKSEFKEARDQLLKDHPDENLKL